MRGSTKSSGVQFSADFITVRGGGQIQECLASRWVSSLLAVNGLFSFTTWISAKCCLMLSQFPSSRKATWQVRIPLIKSLKQVLLHRHLQFPTFSKIFQENRCGKATSSKSRNDKQLTKKKVCRCSAGVVVGWLEIFVALTTMITNKSSRWFGLIIQISEESHPKQCWRCLETVLTLSGVVFSPSWCQGHSLTPTNPVCTLFINDGRGRGSLKIFSSFYGLLSWTRPGLGVSPGGYPSASPRWPLVPLHGGRTNPIWGCRDKRSLTALVRCGHSFSGMDRYLVSCP